MSASSYPFRLKCKHCNHQDRADNCFWYGAAFCCSLCGHPMFSLPEPARDEPVFRCEMCECELSGHPGHPGTSPGSHAGHPREMPESACVASVAPESDRATKLLLCQQCEWERGRAIAFIKGLDD